MSVSSHTIVLCLCFLFTTYVQKILACRIRIKLNNHRDNRQNLTPLEARQSVQGIANLYYRGKGRKRHVANNSTAAAGAEGENRGEGHCSGGQWFNWNRGSVL